MPLPAEVVLVASTTLSSPYFSSACGLGEADGGDLRVAVGDLRDVDVLDHGTGFSAGDLLGHEDALLESAVRELEAGDDVADGVDGADVGVQALVGDDEAAVHGDAGFLVAQAGGGRAAADGDEQQVGLERLAVGQGDHDAVVVLLDALSKKHAGVELDAALAERALEQLDDGLVLVRDQRAAGPRRW